MDRRKSNGRGKMVGLWMDCMLGLNGWGGVWEWLEVRRGKMVLGKFL